VKTAVIILIVLAFIAVGCSNKIQIMYLLQNSVMETYVDTVFYYYENDTSAVALRQYYTDTLFFDRKENFKLCLWKNMILFNDKMIYSFGNSDLSFLYFDQIARFDYKRKKYLYLYPRYFEINGPYMWYELGVLIEFNKGQFIIREDYDYFDDYEIMQGFMFKQKFKLQ
jgi:hypothetical protein